MAISDALPPIFCIFLCWPTNEGHLFDHLLWSILAVVFFDQPTGAPHAVCWSKSIFDLRLGVILHKHILLHTFRWN